MHHNGREYLKGKNLREQWKIKESLDSFIGTTSDFSKIMPESPISIQDGRREVRVDGRYSFRLQHKRYPNIFRHWGCSILPTAKTGAADPNAKLLY